LSKIVSYSDKILEAFRNKGWDLYGPNYDSIDLFDVFRAGPTGELLLGDEKKILYVMVPFRKYNGSLSFVLTLDEFEEKGLFPPSIRDFQGEINSGGVLGFKREYSVFVIGDHENKFLRVKYEDLIEFIDKNIKPNLSNIV